MAEDTELGVKLVPDESAIEDVEDRQIGVGGGNGELSPSGAQQQEGVIAGGVSKGLLAAGILGSILSQLKSVAGFASAILGALSRALIPAVEVLSDIFRPLVQSINDFVSDPVGSINKGVGFNAVENGLLGGFLQNQGLEGTAEGLEQGQSFGGSGGQLVGGALGLGSDIAASLIEPPNPDQSGESKKQQQANKNSDILSDLLGGF